MVETELCLRLLAAYGIGIAIGIERQAAHKPAGLRTQAIVCVSAALLTASSLLLGEELELQGESLRVAAGVVTGIGFIGAGTILQTRHHVLGLTTAATVFMAAAIGIALGAGHYLLALTAAGLTIFSNWVLRYFESEPPSLDTNDEDDQPRQRKLGRPTSVRPPADA
jgi:putative Mg2+ transporter-C (MgtC) family protein